MLQQYLPFTVLKLNLTSLYFRKCATVATVLTVYGIETQENILLQNILISSLQQYLPFTVLKRTDLFDSLFDVVVATVLTVYGIETQSHKPVLPQVCHSCNSTYRLRY